VLFAAIANDNLQTKISYIAKSTFAHWKELAFFVIIIVTTNFSLHKCGLQLLFAFLNITLLLTKDMT